MQTVFDEVWYIVEYLIVKFSPSSLCVDWGKSNTKIIFMHHAGTVNNKK